MKPDVLIIGAGPAGLAAALALGGCTLRTPLDVVVMDGRDPRATITSSTDTRGTALTQATQAMLAALGVSPGLQGYLQEMRDIIVTDGTGAQSDRPRLLSFATEGGRKAAAAMVENRHLAGALLAAVDASPHISLQAPASVTGFEAAGGLARVQTADGNIHSAPLVIAADGRESKLRDMAGIPVKGHAYGQTALSFSILHSLPHDSCAEEHFGPHGVFAVLPLPGNRSSIVWGEAPEEAARLMQLEESDFNAALQDHMGTRLGLVELDGKRAAFPLIMQLADARTALRLALIGDAAHAIHPLAGLGLNLGFKDVAALADCVAQAFARGEDIGGAAMLARYEAWRRFDTLATGMAMEGMNALFVNDNPLLRGLRDAGLKLVDRVPQAKKMLMREASGTSGDIPRLMQGLLPV